MQVNIEKLVDAAVELRIATLRADEQAIIGYMHNSEEFQVFGEDKIAELFKDREYTVEDLKSKTHPYRYKCVITGLKFIALSNKLLFEGDDDKLESEDI